MKLIFENWRNYINERLSIVGYHVAPASAEESIRATGLRGSADSEDKMRKDPGERRVYFFSDPLQAKLAMFDDYIVGNSNRPYILVPFDLRKVNQKAIPVSDPELEDSDIYGPDAYYIVGDVPVEAISQKGIKHEDELKIEDEDEDYYY